MKEAPISSNEATQREDETEMDTPINQEAEETSEETSYEDGQDTSERVPDAEQEKLKREHHDFKVRAQKAETKLKELKKQKNTESTADLSSADPIELAKTVSTLKDYSSDELDYIQVISKGKNISLEDAVKTNEVKTYVEATRKKVLQDNQVPSPSSSSSQSSLGKSDEEMAKLAEKKEDWLKYERDTLKKLSSKRRGI